MSNLLMMSLINFVLSHKNNCFCKQCFYTGGVNEIFNLYSVDDFTHNTLRRVWAWLESRNTFGSCYLPDLNFDATAPKFSILATCMTKSQILKPWQRNLIPSEIPSQQMRERLLKAWDCTEVEFERRYTMFREQLIENLRGIEFKQPVTFTEIIKCNI